MAAYMPISCMQPILCINFDVFLSNRLRCWRECIQTGPSSGTLWLCASRYVYVGILCTHTLNLEP